MATGITVKKKMKANVEMALAAIQLQCNETNFRQYKCVSVDLFVYVLFCGPISAIGIITCLILLILLCFRCRVYPIKVHYVGALFLKVIIAAIVFFRFLSFPILRIIAATNPYAYFFSLLDLVSLALYPLPNILKFFHIAMTFIKFRIKFKYDTLQLKKEQSDTSVLKQQKLVNQIKVIDIWSRAAIVNGFLFLYMILIIFAMIAAVLQIINIAVYDGYGLSSVATNFVNIFYLFDLVFFAILLFLFMIFAICVRIKDPFGIFILNVISVVDIVIAAIIYIPIFICLTIQNTIIRSVGFSLSSLLMLLLLIDVCITVGFPILQTFYWQRRKVNQHVHYSQEQLVIVLNNEQCFNLFYNFCKKEWSSENIMFWKEYQSLVKYDTLDDQFTLVQSIYEKYIDPNGPFALNLDSHTLKYCQECYSARSDLKLMLEKARIKVETVMQDTFSRFKHTKEYNEWLLTQNMQKQVFEELKWGDTQQ